MRMADTLFLDFEGEGRKGLDRVPQLPFLAGLYRPKARGRKSQFSVSLFREDCTPVKNGIPEISEITTLKQIKAYIHDGFWQPMDTLRDKNQLVDLWDNKKAPWKVWS